MEQDNYKIVNFEEYCKTCKHVKSKEENDPCFECLQNPVNLYSYRPVNWEEK